MIDSELSDNHYETLEKQYEDLEKQYVVLETQNEELIADVKRLDEELDREFKARIISEKRSFRHGMFFAVLGAAFGGIVTLLITHWHTVEQWIRSIIWQFE